VGKLSISGKSLLIASKDCPKLVTRESIEGIALSCLGFQSDLVTLPVDNNELFSEL
jgi:hypothetical protein